MKVMSQLELNPNTDRLMDEIEALSMISDSDPPTVTRVLYTETDLKGRRFIKGIASETGLVIREDAVGNIFMSWPGSDPDLSPVATGSHIDAIPFSGKYDGVVGVLGAIEAVRTLKQAGYHPVRTLEVIMFTAEEPTRFGIGCLGSRVLSGNLDQQGLTALRDDSGTPFDKIRLEAGYKGDPANCGLGENYYKAFVELHIEQGPRLEAAETDIGIVTAIAAPATLRVTVEGEGGHAGAVLMPGRRDALLGAAQIALAVQSAAIRCESENGVATTGKFQVFPGAVNSIPSKVNMEIDIRDTHLQARDQMVSEISSSVEQIAQEHGLTCQTQLLNSDDPADCDSGLVELVALACSQMQASHQKMISHAYHDALFMSKVCPTTMIFVPSKNGYSHRPEEYTSPTEIACGVSVLAQVLASLSAD